MYIFYAAPPLVNGGNAVAANFMSFIVIASFSELCNSATRFHFALYVCTYVSHAWALGRTK